MGKKVCNIAMIQLLVIAVIAMPLMAGNKDVAKKMTEKAVEYLKTNGLDKTIIEVNNEKGQFVKGDTYVYLMNLEGVILAHPVNASLRNKNISNLKDNDDFYFIKEILKQTIEKEKSWVTYKWTNPVTKKIAPKHVYSVKVGDVIVSCGAYDK